MVALPVKPPGRVHGSIVRWARGGTTGQHMPPGFVARRDISSRRPLPEESPKANHHDLASFLGHADRVGLSRSSTVFVGTRYEYVVLSGLARYGFDLRRVGGSSDFGIDLLGTWTPPSTPCGFRVILQCKGGSQRPSPNRIRELEGAFAGAPPGWRGGRDVLGFLASENAATKGVRDALGRSRWPMGFVRCSREGDVTQVLWNQAASEGDLSDFDVGVKHGSEGAHVSLIYRGNHLACREPND